MIKTAIILKSMTDSSLTRSLSGFLVGVCLPFVASLASVAGEPPAKLERSVELFSAIKSGEIEAELIAPSARQIFLRVTNKSSDMLNIELPKVFAAVPVLAQFAPPNAIGQGNGLGAGNLGAGNFGAGNLGAGNFGAGNGQGGGGQTGQQLGGGFNNGAGGGNIGGGNQLGNQRGNQLGNPFGNGIGNIGRGAFRVPAGRVGKIAADTICLEHGKPDPNSRMKYRIAPVDEFSGSNQRVAQLCQMLGEKRVTQNVAQAVAWHITSGLSWEQLSDKDRVRSKYQGTQKFFTPEELLEAANIARSLETSRSEYK